MPARRKSKDHDSSLQDRRQKTPSFRKADRSRSLSASSSIVGLSLLEGGSRACRSLSSSPFSSPPSSPNSFQSGQAGGGSSRRERATDRERKRMHSLNDAYDDLRTKVPTYPCSEKPSKIQTLRLAIEYISDLKELLENTDSVNGVDVCLNSDSGISEEAQVSEESSNNGASTTPAETSSSERSALSRSPSRASACSSSSGEALQYKPACNSVLANYITRTTGCATGHSTSPQRCAEPRRVVAQHRGSPPHQQCVSGLQATFPVNVSASYLATSTSSSSPTAITGGGAAVAASQSCFRTSGNTRQTFRDGWSVLDLADSALGFGGQAFSDLQMPELFGELTADSLESLLSGGPLKLDRPLAFDSSLLQPAPISVASAVDCSSGFSAL